MKQIHNITRKMYVLVLVFFLLFGVKRGQTSNKPESEKNEELVPFVWYCGFGRTCKINVPPSFTLETDNYKEGIIKYLRYSDSSYILLHFGLMMKLPFFQEPDYEVNETKTLLDRTYRSGKIKNPGLFWREENGKLLNIGFCKVTKERLELFNKALDSFIIEKKQNQSKTWQTLKR